MVKSNGGGGGGKEVIKKRYTDSHVFRGMLFLCSMVSLTLFFGLVFFFLRRVGMYSYLEVVFDF